MASRFWLPVFGLVLVIRLSGCDSPRVEDTDPFAPTAAPRATAAPPPPPTAVFDPSRASMPVTSDGEGSHARNTTPAGTPVRTSLPTSRTPSGEPGRAPIEFDVVGEETVIDPDSHRGRSKKLKDKQKKAAEEESSGEPAKKP